MTPALAKTDATKIRKEIQEITGELREIKKKSEHKIIRLANLVAQVQKRHLYRQWNDGTTKKPYTSFGAWMVAEIEESRSSVYRFLDVRTHLKSIPDETLESFGSTKCFELVRVAREKPAMLPKFVKELEANPETKLFTLQQKVTNVLAGVPMDSGQYERLEFAVKVEDVVTVVKALAVLQAMDAVKNPETPSGKGVHLVSLAQNFISGREESKILAKLEEAGAFSNAAFEVQGD